VLVGTVREREKCVSGYSERERSVLVVQLEREKNVLAGTVKGRESLKCVSGYS